MVTDMEVPLHLKTHTSISISITDNVPVHHINYDTPKLATNHIPAIIYLKHRRRPRKHRQVACNDDAEFWWVKDKGGSPALGPHPWAQSLPAQSPGFAHTRSHVRA